MRWSRLLVLVAVSPLVGCTMVHQAVHNIQYEHALRADLKDRSALNRQLAMSAWMECVVANGDAVLEPGFTDGFVDGFADYLDRGGAGESPPVPPQQYWKVEWANAHGKDVARRYLQGFAQGAAAARASELRQDSVVVVQPPMIYTGLPPSQLPPPVVEPRLPTLPPPLDSKPLLDFKPPATRAPDIEFGPSPRPVIFVSLPDDPAPIGFDRSPVRSYEPDR